MKWLAAHYRTGETWEFEFAGGKVVSRQPRAGRTKLVFGPGFFDLQCNGYGGVDFNHPDVTPEEVCRGIRAMWREGCTHVLPTLITASPERLKHLFGVLNKALELDREVAASVPGFHLEGPFISPIDGARGAHPLAHVVPANEVTWRALQKSAAGRIALLTLAPEVPGALSLIRRLVGEGVTVAVAHTMATREEIAAAAATGAVMSTHLGNGCPQVMHRHANPMMAQLGEDRLSACLIADGIHLPPEVLRAFWRAKGPGRRLLVTDAMAAAGAPPGRYTISEMEMEVGPDRVVRQPGSPNFAGSALTMDLAVYHAVTFAEATLAEAWDAASTEVWKIMNRRVPASSWTILDTTSPRPVVVAAGRGKKVLSLQQK